MNSRPLPYQGSALPLSYTGVVGAEDEVRTRDPQLGRLMLYRLSYFRIRLNTKIVGRAGFEPTKACASRFTVCPSWPLWYLPIIYISKKLGADGGIRTPDQLITNQLLWPTELHRQYVNSPLQEPLSGFLFVWDCKDMRFVFIYQTFFKKNQTFFQSLTFPSPLQLCYCKYYQHYSHIPK